MNQKSAIFVVLILVLGCASCTEKEPPAIPKNKITTIGFHSKKVNEDYQLYIHLPEKYHADDTKYPVLYQLDGNTTTGSVIRDKKMLVKNGEIRDCIIVAIDYTHENQRVRDYTPSVSSEFENSGGAGFYYDFLVQELIPYIDSLYRTDKQFGNTLRGHSLGGLFASYALFHNPTTRRAFQHFIIESPSWWWDHNYAFEQEHEYAKKYTELHANVYFAVGELEGAAMKGPFQAMQKKIEERQYVGLRKKHETLKGQSHLDVRENPKGLKYIFRK